MVARPTSRGCMSVLLVLGGAWELGFLDLPRAGAQEPTPIRGEFQVNTFTTEGQHDPFLASDSNGNFVVVWMSYGIRAQRFASNGSRRGEEFQVNTYTTTLQDFPSVATDSDGDFVVVWVREGVPGVPSPQRIRGRRYDSNGSAQGGEFPVNANQVQFPSNTVVATDADGDFVVVWNSYFASTGTDYLDSSIQGRRFASNGSPQGGDFQVNTDTTGNQFYPSAAADQDGDFVVVWSSPESSETDTSGKSIQGQRYASDGSAQGVQFQVNTYTTSTQDRPSVAAAANGGFVVMWESNGSFETDISGFSIQGQRYASDGSLQGAQFQVNSYTTFTQLRPSVTANANGDFVVVWENPRSPGTDQHLTSVQGQRYASDGSAQGAQFQLNSYTTGVQDYAWVASAANGDFVVTWRSDGSAGTDDSLTSIQGQLYNVTGPLPVPALSHATRFALGAALLLLGAAYALRRRS
jgi:hypothetical protein